MMSFDNVLIMEPNFITFFTPIRKLQYQTHFLLMSAFCSAQNLSIFYLEKCTYTFDFTNFLFKSSVLIPFGMLAPKTISFFSAQLAYPYMTFHLVQLAKIHLVD